MEKINLSGKLNFENIDLTAPNIVIENIASQIKEQTNNTIIGSIETYDGIVIPSYNTPRNILTSLNSALYSENESLKIQRSLGKNGDETNKYEFYLSTPIFKQYKYRICFIQYGIANYPVNVVLEQSVADEIKKSVNSDYIYKCNNRTELENLIINVINTKQVINVMQELIYVHQIHIEDKNVN